MKFKHHMQHNLQDLYLSVQADVMAGQLQSNVCRMQHELHDALGKARYPYIPIGSYCQVCSIAWLFSVECDPSK